MIQLSLFLGAGLLLFAVLALWARQGFLAPRRGAEVSDPRPFGSGIGTFPHGDLRERIFGLQDWHFVLRETPEEIQRMFQRERTVLVISWLRRERSRVSQVMRAHVGVARQSENLQLATETRLALSYFLFLVLCNSLIGWVWFYGPVRTRKLVGQTLKWAAQVRGA